MPQAVEQWCALDPDEQLQQRIAGAVEAWKRSAEWQRNAGQFVPALWKFLRDQRWLDAPGSGGVPSAEPAAPQVVQLTPEQLRRNGERAREVVARAKLALGRASDAGAAAPAEGAAA